MCAFDGSRREVLISEDLHHTYGLTVSGSRVYWTDWQLKTIKSARKDTGGDVATIHDSLEGLMAIKAVNMNERGMFWLFILL